MYNRYIPQSDGSYRRSRVKDTSRPPRPRPEPISKPEPECAPEPERECRPEPPLQKGTNRQRCPRQNGSPPPHQNHRSARQEKHEPGIGIGSFLRQLLPRDFETEDLLVVLLLLLMSGNCADDQNSALLTLALYLFM